CRHSVRDFLKCADDSLYERIHRDWFGLSAVHRNLFGQKGQTFPPVLQTVADAEHRAVVSATAHIDADVYVVVESLCRREWHAVILDGKSPDAVDVMLARARWQPAA